MEKRLEIRPLGPDESDAWFELRTLLWPGETRETLAQELAEIAADPKRNAVLVAATREGELIGFVEVSLRDWADGCSTHPVGYIEGWYVLPEHRRAGIGRRLIEAAESWAAARGCSEMGSDAELHNETSHRAHQAIGFREVIRVVLFSKKLR